MKNQAIVASINKQNFESSLEKSGIFASIMGGTLIGCTLAWVFAQYI